MTVDGKLLEILCCPVSKVPLARLEKSRLKKLNAAIDAGAVDYVSGERVAEPLTDALITEDGKVIYAVADGIPILLGNQGIGTTQLQDF
ncbi:Trm112 family protein [Elongatibacter sediminis]|uniref:Trm112 family protein n=1 Tax=Elongatibacter sediminis TaxID=3119006 RepID=A0AAW9RG35_9GAMM